MGSPAAPGLVDIAPTCDRHHLVAHSRPTTQGRAVEEASRHTVSLTNLINLIKRVQRTQFEYQVLILINLLNYE